MAWTSIEAEQSLIGSLLLEPDRCHDVAGKLTADDFTHAAHRLIYAALQSMAGLEKPIDVVTLSEYLADTDRLDQAGGLAYIGTLAKNTPTAANVLHYAELVREKARRRRLRDVLSQGARDAEHAALDELLGELSSRAEAIATAGSSALAFTEAFALALRHIDEDSQAMARGGVVGVPTGLPAIDKRTGGLQARRLIILAARPSVGKTALANQIALHAASRGHPVGIISLEMGVEELTIRAMARSYKLNVSALSFGDDCELGRLTAAMKQRSIADLPIWIDTETTSLGGVVSRLSEWKRRHGIELGIVDHIGLIEGGDGASRNDWLGKVSRSLKLAAKRLCMPILAVSQLGRGVERDKRRPVLSDLRDSGNIEQDADICIFLHVEGDAKETADGLPIEIGLLKNRIGRRGWLPEQFAFAGRTQTILEIEQATRYSGDWQSGAERALPDG